MRQEAILVDEVEQRVEELPLRRFLQLEVVQFAEPFRRLRERVRLPKTVRWRAKLGYERASPSAEGSPPPKRRKGP